MRRRRSLPVTRVGQRVVIVVGALARLAGEVVKCDPCGQVHLAVDGLPPGVIVQIHCRHVRPQLAGDAPQPPTPLPPE